MPITWQNIRGANLADASRPLELAQRTMDNALDKFGNILKQREDTETANWQTGKVNNTNAALAALQQYDSPEEFQAAQKAGALQALLNQNGAQIDQREVRNSIDGRLAMLQQRAKQGIDYENTARDQREAPIMDEAMSMINSGDPILRAKGQQILEANKLRQEAGAYLALNNAKQQEVVRGRDETRFKWDGDKMVMDGERHRSAMDTDVLQRGAIRAQTDASRAATEINRAELEIKRNANTPNAKAAAGLAKIMEDKMANGPLSLGVLGNAKGLKSLTDNLKSYPGMRSGDDEDIMKNMSEKFNKGIKVPVMGKDGKPTTVTTNVPVAVILEELGNTRNTFLPGYSNRGEALADRIYARFGLNSKGEPDSKVVADKAMIDELLQTKAMQVQREDALVESFLKKAR